jgi:hypothetical protein
LASTFTPNDGTVQEWSTSAADTNNRIWVLNGRMVRLFTSKSRKSEVKLSVVGIMKESNSMFKKSEYSYLQYHWCPTVFKVIEGFLVSSNK